MKDKKVSIITAVRNASSTIEQTILSVLGQEYANYEYIVIDGASTDGTLDIISKYKDLIDIFISEPDKGVYDAMNKAVKHATGEWLYFIGADDILTADLGGIARKFVDRKTIYYGDVYRPGIGRKYDGKFNGYKLASRNICHQAIFYPRIVFEKYSYNLKYSIMADYELNMRCWHDKEIEMEYLATVVAKYNDKDGISAIRIDEAFYSDRRMLINENFSRIVFIATLMRFLLIDMLICVGIDKFVFRIYNRLIKLFRNSDDLKL